MTVYRLQASTKFQSLCSATRDPCYVGRQYLHFNCERQGENWKPPEYYAPEPLLPKGDFVGIQGYDPIALRRRAWDAIGWLFTDNFSELLRIDAEGEPLWIINVLRCYNALDYEKTEWRSQPGKSSIRKHAFHDNRFSNYPLFKIPETMVNQTLLAHGVVHHQYDLKNLCEHHGLTGLEFVELWSDGKPGPEKSKH